MFMLMTYDVEAKRTEKIQEVVAALFESRSVFGVYG